MVAMVAAVGAAIFLAGTLVPFPSTSAQDGTPPAEPTKRERFLQRVADKLGIDVAQLEQAVKDARLEMVDEALANGRINEEQAAKARERIENGERAGLGRFKERHQQRHERVAKLRGALIEESAGAIGISADELRAELKAGKSIADVAAEHGVSLDDVKAQIIAAAEAKLQQAVENGRIDQAKADEALQRLSDRLDEVLNRKREAPAPATP
jgi:uncharacterized protein (DUF2267 family)